MSGGVGTSSDIRLPKEEEETYKPFVNEGSGIQKPHHKRVLFTFQQLNALAVIIVLSASGMVGIEDLAFVVFSLVYMYFISKVAFPSLSSQADPPVFGQRNKILTLYVFVGALMGLLLPIAYIFEGIFEGDKEGIKAASPHVFLLASQVFMEGVSFSGRFSLPIRVFVPVFYNSRRIFTIAEWLRNEIYKVDSEYGGNTRRLYIGRALAFANMAFWCFNLFGFLLPFYLPRAFKIYYSSGNKELSGRALAQQRKMSGVVDENYKHRLEDPSLSPSGRRFFLTFRQLNALAGMLVLSAFGLVSVQDWAFVAFSLAYTNFLSKVAFPTLSSPANSRVFGEKNRLLNLYVLFSGVISFVFPVPYILEGFLQGDEGIKAAASHVFLLASQIFMEGVAFHSGFSLPVFVFVPVFYNSRRIFTIVEWLRGEIYKVGGSTRRVYVGRTLAAANMAFWCFNLFGFLLPVFLPKAFKVYYSAQKGLK